MEVKEREKDKERDWVRLQIQIYMYEYIEFIYLLLSVPKNFEISQLAFSVRPILDNEGGNSQVARFAGNAAARSCGQG